MANLFQGPEFGPFVHGVRAVEVLGKTGPRHLLAGWLADRLDLPTAAVRLEEARHATMRLTAEDPGGRRGHFSVIRDSDDRMVRAAADIEGGPTSEAVLQLPESTPAWGLADALAHLERDAVYEGALRRAVGP